MSELDPLIEWMVTHALALWALLLLLALWAGDLAWRYSARWHQRAVLNGRAPTMLRWQTALVLVVVLGALFVLLAAAVGAPQPGELVRIDTSLATGLRTHLPLPALHVIAQVTRLGDPWWIATAATVVAIILLLRRHWREAITWMVALFGVVPINGSLKALFQRVRPLHDHGLIIETSWSFPSGHAFGAIVFYGMLAFVLLRLSPRFHRAIIAGAVLLAGLVGISQILLQVHYLSDVLAGYTAGAIWLVLCIGGATYLRRHPTAVHRKEP